MPKLIAIIDDELEMEFIYSMILEKSLSKKLIKIQFFSDVRDFLTWLETNQPQLIMSDMNMPYLTGIELGRRIRQTDLTTPTYLVSGDAADESEAVVSEAGFCRYITKPLNFEQVENFILSDLGLSLS